MATHTIPGIHHITAIAGDPQRTVDFYTQLLGLRLVKLTVNFDDPGTYHLYFGDGAGAPGTILTFFPWPGAPRGVVGNGQVSAIAFAVGPGSLEFWRSRLEAHQVSVQLAGSRLDEPVLPFRDPDGLPLELIETQVHEDGEGWNVATIPRPHRIGGFHSATLSLDAYEQTASLLEQTMGFRRIATDGHRLRFVARHSRGAIVDVLHTPGGQRGDLGAGTVHHIAFRTPSDAQQETWRAELVEIGYHVTAIIDRSYFRSIYFREPGHVLFEIATDPPGFTTDETPAHLGERLMLPAWLESSRSRIEQSLPTLKLPTSV